MRPRKGNCSLKPPILKVKVLRQHVYPKSRDLLKIMVGKEKKALAVLTALRGDALNILNQRDYEIFRKKMELRFEQVHKRYVLQEFKPYYRSLQRNNDEILN